VTDRPLTWDDMAASVEQDIAKAREQQREATATGNHFTAEQHGNTIDSYLDEHRRYSY
jgi:hypothetical protein